MYAIIAKVSGIVTDIMDNRNGWNEELTLIINLNDHNQGVYVKQGWFYDQETDTFYEEEPEISRDCMQLVRPLMFEEQAILETANNVDYLVCLKDLGL